MRHRARLAGYPVHPLLVVFPLGLLLVSVILDVIGAVTRQPIWGTVACWNIVVGIACGIVAGIFGLIDLAEIPSQTRAATVGVVHAVLNLAVLGLFSASLVLRALDVSLLPSVPAIILSVAGLALAGVSSWLGNELTDRLGVTVIDADSLYPRSSLPRSHRS
jgi:uncharacterized membrane protein